MEAAYRKLSIVALVLAAAIVIANGLCGMSDEGLNSCEPSVTSKNPLPPSVTCCTALKTADLKCLCSYKNLLLSLGLDPKQAMKLPAKCNITTSVTC